MASAPSPPPRLDRDRDRALSRWRSRVGSGQGAGRGVTPPPTGPREQPALLDTFLRILRVRKWWVLQALIIVPLVVTLLTLRQEERFTAEASLLFRDAATSVLGEDIAADFTDPSRAAATNDQLINLPVVSERASDALGGRVDPQTIEQSVTVTPSGESDLVTITAEAGDGYLAARMANVYGESYIAFRQRSDRRQLQEAIDLARQRLDELPPDLQAGAPGAELNDRLNRLLLAQSLLTGSAELVQRASVPSEPSSPDLRRNLILGILLGAVLGLGLGALRERFDQSIKSEEELEQVYGAPVLVRLPRSSKLDRNLHLERTPEAEAFRILRANLRYFDVDSRLKSVLVSSPVSGDGKSTVARGLAMTMASVGDHVVLVEADLHKGTSPTLGTPADVGLSSVLSGVPLDEALVHVDVGDERRLTVLPAGPVPPNPVSLLESNRMAELLTVLERRFELVVIDSPALSHVSDARPLVGEVSGILIVSAIGRTGRRAAIDFRKQLELLEGNPLGVVANMAPMPRSGYYY
jgi:capsular exopolysaccharide synthesis family protein